MRHLTISIFACLLVVVLVSCGGQLSAKGVAQQLANAGLPISNISDGPLAGAAIQGKATSHALFYIPSTKYGGHVYVCDTSIDCAVYVGYFTNLPPPLKSNAYQSKSGRVVVVIGADTAPTIAQHFQEAVEELP